MLTKPRSVSFCAGYYNGGVHLFGRVHAALVSHVAFSQEVCVLERQEELRYLGCDRCTYLLTCDCCRRAGMTIIGTAVEPLKLR